ncbi:MAG TPA: mechanosensitive ion channel domain-containing protein [Pyrinomonadaceae bacterium]
MFAQLFEGTGGAASVVSPARVLMLNVWMWWQQAAETPLPEPSAVVKPDRSWMQILWYDYINRPLVIGDTLKISVASLGLGIALFLVALILSRSLRAFLERRLAARTHLDPGLQYTILRVTHYVIVAVGVLYAAKLAFNADLTTFAVVFTALSLGIGFGLQFIAGDIASGFILLFERPVRVGDFVTVTGPDSRLTEGRVMSINLRTTVVMTNDHIAAIVPNSKLVNQNLINWSYGERRSRISIPVGVSYDSDVELVTDMLLRAAEGVKHVLAEPKPSVQFMEFGDSSLNFRLLVWTDRARRYPQIKSDINYRIRRFFLEAGIEIPFPQRDLNVRGGSLQVALQSDTRNGESGARGREFDEEEAELGAKR